MCLEATDKPDLARRTTPANRELVVQGIGNTLSGLVGGLPDTQIVVRIAANTNEGAISRWVTILRGVLLLLCVLFILNLRNLIPNASLAAILILAGYKLTSF